jgi:hypothetical protein
MTLRIQRLVNVAMVLITWLTIPLLGSRNIKRFLPASILIVVIDGISIQIGKKLKWWVFYNKPKSYLFGEFPFSIGPFFVSSLWTLKWAYGNFKKFILLNAIINVIFAFPVANFARKFRYYTLVRLTNFQFFLNFISKAFLLYGIQYLFEPKDKRKF